MACTKLPDITKLIGSKNFMTDASIILLGFVIIGFASTMGTWAFKYIWNERLRNYVPDGEKIPY